MKICVYGAGAIGGVIAFHLAAVGHDVVVVTRGDHLAAIRSNGLTVVSEAGQATQVLSASANAAEFGPQDLVIVAVKAHSLPSAAHDLTSLISGETPVLFALNGVPWWYTYKCGGKFDGMRLEVVDPGGIIWNTIGPERALGSVVYIAASVRAPGIVEHHFANKLIIGEPDGSISARLTRVVGAFEGSALKAEATMDIRSAVFGKLLNTVSFSPVCTLTQSPMDATTRDPRTQELIRNLMLECLKVGSALGVQSNVDVDERIASFATAAPFRPSMLQDLEAGKALEIDPLVAAILELGKLAEVPTPLTDAIYALVRRLAESKGLYALP